MMSMTEVMERVVSGHILCSPMHRNGVAGSPSMTEVVLRACVRLSRTGYRASNYAGYYQIVSGTAICKCESVYMLENGAGVN